jgi:anti-sigma factor ChrR (cupin superfamily)
MKEFTAVRGEEIDLISHRHVSKNTGNVTFEQMLVCDEDTGMSVKQILYPKGSITPPHTHRCAHGMYVLKGTLHTDKGDFGPGSFVWFKEGSEMTHGGLDEDVECLFITNKAFDISYL